MVIALSQLPQHRGKKRCRDEAGRLRKEAETPQTCPKCSPLDMSAQNHSNRARHIASCQPCGSRKRPASNSLTGHRRPDAPVAMRSMTSFFAPRAPTTTATTSEATTTTTTTAAAEATGTTAEATPPSARAPEFPLVGWRGRGHVSRACGSHHHHCRSHHHPAPKWRALSYLTRTPRFVRAMGRACSAHSFGHARPIARTNRRVFVR